MMWMVLEFFSQVFLILLTSSLIMNSNLLVLDRSEILRFLIEMVVFLMKAASSLLFLMIEHLDEITLSSMIGIMIVRGV